MTDNLSKSLQPTKMLAIKGKKFADLITETIEKMRNDGDFKMFYQTVKKVSEAVETSDAPNLLWN